MGTDEEGEDITSCVIDPLGASETTGPEKARKPLSRSDEIARRALVDLLGSEGVTPRDSHVPPKVTLVVTLEAWRDEFRRRGDFQRQDGEDQAKADARFRQEWKRTHESLVTKGVAMILGGHAWLA